MSAAVDRVLDALRACGCDPKPDATGYKFRCLAHDDRTPSAHLSEGDEGRAIIFCQAGCSCEKIVASVGLTMADLFSDSPKTERREIASYDYADENGKLLYQVVRFNIKPDGTPKDFRQRRPDGKGGWVWNLGDTRRVLFGLPGLVVATAAKWTIYVVEGEKDVEAINGLESGGEFYATCNPMGAGKWRSEYNATLKGANVVIIADNDEPGRKHALDVRASLRGIAASVEIKQAKTGKDAFDHLAAGHGLADFVPMPEPGAAAGTWTPCTLQGVTDPNVGSVECLVNSFVPKGDIVGVVATFKSGKSLAMYSLMLSALRADRVFGMFSLPRPLRVVVFQEEMPSREDNRRLRRLAIGKGMDPADVPAFVASGQLVFYNRVGLDLSTPEGIARFHEAVRAAKADLAIIDSLIAAAGDVDLDKNGPVRRMFTAAFLPLTTEGRSIVYMHHKRKGVQGAKLKDSDRDSFLGAQAIAASSSRMYSLERLTDPDDAPKDPTRFRCALTLFGSWTPEEAVSTVLETRDEGEGTTVTALDEAAQVQSGGIDGKQRAAIALVKIVNIRRCVRRRDAIKEVAEDLGLGERTVADGLRFAKQREWIGVEKVPGSKSGELDLIPGDRWEDAL